MSISASGLGQPELHHRQQAVPAGDDAGLLAVPLEQFERVLDAGRPRVLEWCRYLHLTSMSEGWG